LNLKHLFKQVVVFVVAWYLLYFMTFGLHEQFHALVLHLLGIESKVTFVWVGPVPIAAFTWPEVWPVARLALALVGLAGGLGVAACFICLDLFVPGIHSSRGLDLALNYHVGQQATYAVGEALAVTQVISPPMFQVVIVLSYLVGVLFVLLELTGVINI